MELRHKDDFLVGQNVQDVANHASSSQDVQGIDDVVGELPDTELPSGATDNGKDSDVRYDGKDDLSSGAVCSQDV